MKASKEGAAQAPSRSPCPSPLRQQEGGPGEQGPRRGGWRQPGRGGGKGCAGANRETQEVARTVQGDLEGHRDGESWEKGCQNEDNEDNEDDDDDDDDYDDDDDDDGDNDNDDGDDDDE